MTFNSEKLELKPGQVKKRTRAKAPRVRTGCNTWYVTEGPPPLFAFELICEICKGARTLPLDANWLVASTMPQFRSPQSRCGPSN